MARQALSSLGDVGSGLLQGDRCQIWVARDSPLEIDLVTHEAALRTALGMEPGSHRDVALSAALLENGVLLADEPYSDWALEPRDALELLRQKARFELARDRTKGEGRSHSTAVIDAWEACLAHDPGSEEAAASLMRAYAAQGQRQLVVRTYRRCREGLAEVGLEPSSALEKTYCWATDRDLELVVPWSNAKFEWVHNPRVSLGKSVDFGGGEGAGRALVRS